MSDFADELNSWVARQAQASVEEQVIAMYAEENPAPEGQGGSLCRRNVMGMRSRTGSNCGQRPSDRGCQGMTTMALSSHSSGSRSRSIDRRSNAPLR